jgi:hypothetical protein
MPDLSYTFVIKQVEDLLLLELWQKQIQISQQILCTEIHYLGIKESLFITVILLHPTYYSIVKNVQLSSNAKKGKQNSVMV